jgi:pimeloyl-ACP methyl ester carboxylesterase
MVSQNTKSFAAQQTFRVRVPPLGLNVLVRHERPSRRGAGDGKPPVLFIHGSSFPSALAFAFEFDGTSWMGDLAARGFDVWAFDFIGYGGSDRYPEMRDPAHSHPPLGRAPVAAEQIAAVIDFIQSHARVPRVSLIAHSWGTIPTGLFAGQHPDAIDRIVDFGPVAQRTGAQSDAQLPAYDFVTEQDQRDRFDGYVPRGLPHVLADPGLLHWGPAYMATDSSSHSRSPASVEVPNGPSADVADAWSGHLPYDPALITAPVLIVRGEWDVVTKDADAQWLWDALQRVSSKRDVKIARGTHVMHLEISRAALFDEVAGFLSATDREAARARLASQPTRRPFRCANALIGRRAALKLASPLDR